MCTIRLSYVLNGFLRMEQKCKLGFVWENHLFDSFLATFYFLMFILSSCVTIDFNGHKLSFVWFTTTISANAI